MEYVEKIIACVVFEVWLKSYQETKKNVRSFFLNAGRDVFGFLINCNFVITLADMQNVMTVAPSGRVKISGLV